MKNFFYIALYITLVNAFNNIVKLNNVRLALKINFKMQDSINVKTINKNKLGILDHTEFKRIAKFSSENNENILILKKKLILDDCKASNIVGYKEFDPLNCTNDSETLKKYRKAEIKHGRLTMLATFEWPFTEFFHPYLSEIT